MAARKPKRAALSKPKEKLLARIMPRHAHFYAGIALGLIALAVAFWLAPELAIPIGSNVFFVSYLGLSLLKLPALTADYLRDHARDEDAPAGGLFLVMIVVAIASLVSLFIALSDSQPDVFEVVLCVASVILGWFTIHAACAFHYAYEYYQMPEANDRGEKGIVGGLGFPGDEEPDGFAFFYFSFAVGSSVATSDTKVTSNTMRRRVGVHSVLSHLYNTIILASAVNVVMALGGGG